ncbi:hypothetical protein FQA39_LY05955 [Lamprigera yunnana]|nr:hypothetical protein FQA39_LY05955 [Lamprigera yunnana]
MPAIDNYSSSSKVRTYVYGMEALMSKKPILATGSLESRTSRQVNGICGNRNEDWYNRRKSYGFEQVLNHHDSINSISKSKTPIDSSTDSGICRSSEIVLVPTINKVNPQLNDFENDSRQNVGNVKRYASIFEGKKDSSPEDTHYTNRSSLRDYEGTKISIPIVPLQDNYNKFNYRNDKNTQNAEIKRHSIAVDESKYVTRSSSNNNYRRTSLAITDKFQGDSYLNDCLDDDSSQGRRHKKVEFCKTEVHFAVDSGRINIVATDEKPPPTNNFRRRRRNSGTLYSNLLTEANKNGLPILHFGDTSYEKSMFNVTDNEDDTIDQQSDLYGTNKSDLFSENTVTVSTNQSGYNYQNNVEEEKENVECETPKGILKNKPVKPKPYLLGDDPFCTNSSTDEKEIWGVKLKPVNITNDPPMWKSTVTLKNTLYDKRMEEFPNKLEDVEPFLNEEHSEQFDNIRIISSQPSSKRSSWNDKMKQAEDVQKNEIKGYSTKVNIGDGNVTVIEDDVKDLKRQILNKGLVVRIGRNDDNSHTICSKVTTDKDSKTTTTKITIDLSPSPTNVSNEKPSLEYVRLPRASLSNFKSTSLVLNTFKTDHSGLQKANGTKSNIPQQLEALKKLYEDWQSDSEADKEVQLLMNKTDQEPLKEFDDANSSVVSGSWSKMKAFRNMQQQRVKNVSESCFNSHARLEKGSLNAHQTRIEIKKEAATPPTKKESPKLSDLHQRKVKLNNRTPMSPVVLRRTCCETKKQDLKTAYNTEKLSSPSLVGQNHIKANGNWKKETTSYASNLTSRSSSVEKRSPSPAKRQPLTYSPTPSLENHHKTSKHSENVDGERCKSPNRSVLRNPRRSEMAYFGVKMSPSPNPQRKLTDKNRLKSKEEVIPIYENIDTVRNNKNKINKREFDSSILDELTKAADQILQAVNGYAEETEKQSLEEEKKRSVKKEKLDTISETKSWKQRNVTNTTKHSYNSVAKPKLKHTSSTSSVESVPESRKSLTPNQRSLESDRHKKKSSSDSSSSRAATKARRLQRASSREALLQSHGSSSEDLPVNLEVPLRKPRLVRKTKSCLSETNATDEIKVRKGHDKVKSEERWAKLIFLKCTNCSRFRVPVGALPTIRHKTAVSTIRSTAEKAQMRERNNRLRSEDAKRKATRNEMSRITSTAKSDKSRNAPTKEPITHRISTAYVPLYRRRKLEAKECPCLCS